MTPEEEFHENLKKVLGISSEENPVTRTASGMMMLMEDPFARIRREAEMFIHGISKGRTGRFTHQETCWLMVAFTEYLWKRQELIRKAMEEKIDTQPLRFPLIPELDLSEAWFIKNIVAEAIGSQDVDFNASAAAAVQKLRNAYKYVLGTTANRMGGL